MKRILIALFIIILAFNAHAQKCKWDYNKKDEITGEETKAIRTEYVSIIQTGKTFTLSVEFYITGQRREVIYKGDTLIVKLENGKIFKLNAKEDNKPAANASSYTVFSGYAPIYLIPKELLAEFKTSPITYLRVASSEITFDFEKLRSKDMEKIRKGAECMDSNFEMN